MKPTKLTNDRPVTEYRVKDSSDSTTERNELNRILRDIGSRLESLDASNGNSSGSSSLSFTANASQFSLFQQGNSYNLSLAAGGVTATEINFATFDTDDIAEGATNLYFTDERAQDAVGGMVNATLTYVDGTPSLGINLSNANTWTATQSFSRVVTSVVQASSSAGILFESNNGTDVADFGAGGGSNASFFGGVNIDGQTRLATSLTGYAKLASGVVSAQTGVPYSDLTSIPAAIDAIDGLTPAADRLPYYTGASTAALATFTASARSLLADATVPRLSTSNTWSGATNAFQAVTATTLSTTGNATFGASSGSYLLNIVGNGSLGACTAAWVDTSNSNKEWRIDQSAGNLRFIESGVAERFTLTGTGASITGTLNTTQKISTTSGAGTNALQIAAGARFYLDGGGDTWIEENSANVIGLVAAGSTMVTVANSGVTLGSSFGNTHTVNGFLDTRPAGSGIMFRVLETTSGSSRRIQFSNSGTANRIESSTGSGSTTLELAVDTVLVATLAPSSFAITGTLSTTGAATLCSSSGSVLCGSAADNGGVVIAKGGGKAVRLGASIARAVVEGVDETGFASYQPLFVGGSTTSLGVSGVEHMRVNSAGNVLIGTTTDNGEKLQVSGATSTSTYFTVDGVVTTDANTGTQAATVNLANGSVQKLERNGNFNLTVTGPSSRHIPSCTIYIYLNTTGSVTTTDTNIRYWFGPVYSIGAARTRVLHGYWDGTNFNVTSGGDTATGDIRPS